MRRFVPCFVCFCLLIWGLPQTASAQADTRRANRPLSTETAKKASRKQELREYNQKLSNRYLAGLTKWKLYKGASLDPWKASGPSLPNRDSYQHPYLHSVTNSRP